MAIKSAPPIILLWSTTAAHGARVGAGTPVLSMTPLLLLPPPRVVAHGALVDSVVVAVVLDSAAAPAGIRKVSVGATKASADLEGVQVHGNHLEKTKCCTT